MIASSSRAPSRGIVELDLAQQDIAVYDGGYESYLAEREIARQHAREAFEEYAGTRSDLEDRAQMQRNWMEHGVRNARRKAKDNDKIGRGLRTESTEKQAAKARQTQRRIERLEVVEEPRKEWELRMEIAAAPRSGSVVATTNGAKVTRGQFTFGPVTTQIDWGRSNSRHGRERGGRQDHPPQRPARQTRPGRGHRVAGFRCRDR